MVFVYNICVWVVVWRAIVHRMSSVSLQAKRMQGNAAHMLIPSRRTSLALLLAVRFGIALLFGLPLALG